MPGIECIALFDRDEVRQRAGAHDLMLTGMGRLVAPSKDEHADMALAQALSDGMTFVQQQSVMNSVLIDVSPGDSIDKMLQDGVIEDSIPMLGERSTFGPSVIEDIWSPTSRPRFLREFLNRFAKEHPADHLRKPFYYQIAISRLTTPFVELHHFLAFSALEIAGRRHTNFATHGNAAVPITRVLNDNGFRCTQVEIEEWAQARNKLFHEGEFVHTSNSTGQEIKLLDQIVPLHCVAHDLMMKLLPFDDGIINWNRWRDRQAWR